MTVDSLPTDTTVLDGDDLRRAALVVCDGAGDATTARDLLEALGLLDALRAEHAAA